jgi:hypothetical protein
LLVGRGKEAKDLRFHFPACGSHRATPARWWDRCRRYQYLPECWHPIGGRSFDVLNQYSMRNGQRADLDFTRAMIGRTANLPP